MVAQYFATSFLRARLCHNKLEMGAELQIENEFNEADSTKTGVRSANQSGYVDKYVGGNWIVDALGQQ